LTEVRGDQGRPRRRGLALGRRRDWTGPPSSDRLQGRLRGEGPGLYLERLADLHEGADAHATQEQDLGAEPLDIFEHTGGRRFEFDPGGEPEVAGQPLVSVDDPVAVVEDDELAAAREERGHFKILPLLVLSPDDGHEVQFEGRIHGAKRLLGEIEGARLPEHAVGEDVDAPPACRRRATKHVEGRLLGQFPDANLREFWSDLGDPGLHVRPHLGEVLAQGLMEHVRLGGNRGQKKHCDHHHRTKLLGFGFPDSLSARCLLLVVFFTHGCLGSPIPPRCTCRRCG
jgi:hypothetical protein